jgi:hypothetical protein
MKKASARGGQGAGRPAGSAGSGKNAQAINRILVGVRIEPRLVKVMKALAELHDCALGELIERVFWNSMDGGSLFAEKNGRLSNDTRQQIESLKKVYGVNYSLEELQKPKVRGGA